MSEENLGCVQMRILQRAQMSKVGFVRPSGYLEMRAIRRLVKRGLLVPAIGWPDTWKLPY